MTDVSSIRDLIGLWPQRAALAGDVNGIAGREVVTVSQVQKWSEKESIPAKFHWLVIQAAQTRGHHVSADLIAELHDAWRRPVQVSGVEAAE